MNSSCALENNDDVLEVISDAENVVILDSEHEEGEISSDESGEEDGEISSLSMPSSPHHMHNYPDRFSPSPSRPHSVTSEVVIYDDHGRTAIFTSPRKKTRVLSSSSYTVVTEATKSWSRDEVGHRRDRDGVSRRERDETSSWRERETGNTRREKEETRERENSGGNSSKYEEEDRDRRKWHVPHIDTKSKGKADISKRAREKRTKSDKTKGGYHSHCQRCKKVSSSDSSSESSSCSCSSSSDESEDNSPAVPVRGKGKENKSCVSVSRAGDKSHPQQEYSPKRPPPKSVIRLPLTHKPTSKSKPPQKKLTVSAPKSKFRKYVEKQSSKKQTQSSKNSHHTKPESKPVQLSWEDMKDLPMLKGQKKPPPGSLGEMLLKKKIVELKLQSKRKGSAANSTAKDSKLVKTSDSNKGKVEKFPSGLEPECYTLDQEDEDELQLRLIALQSSLRFLSDIRKEGQKEGSFTLSSSGDTNSGVVVNENLLSLVNQSSQLQHPESGSFAAKSESWHQLKDLPTGSAETSALTMEALHQATELKPSTSNLPDIRELILKAEQAIILDELNGSTSKPVSLSSSPEHEPYSYSDSSKEPTEIGERLKQVHMKNEEFKGTLKEQQDSNQDPVDMDICDSSGEEDECDIEVEELVREVGERYHLDTPDSPAHISSVIHNPVSDVSGIMNESGAGVPEGAPNTLQIPVEWAYMMPPPPPPDQPANDIDNIDNWCYDQNMYLQTMQVSFEANNEYLQYGMESMGSGDWGQQQQQQELQNPQWCSPNRDSYEQMEDPSLPIPQLPVVQNRSQLEPDQIESTDVCQPIPEFQTDLKNTPAEQYQAFMSVVLNKQSPPPKKGHSNDRTLIQVPIIKNGSTPADPLKKAEARRRRRARQKQKLRELKGTADQKAVVQSMVETQEVLSPKSVHSDDSNNLPAGSEHSTAQSSNSGAEEEDEDVLRAQLLIDMSIRKQQKENLSEKSVIGQQVPVAGTSFITSKKNSSLKSTATRKEAGSRSSYLSQSSELPSVAKPPISRSLLQKNVTARSKSLEGSPSHLFKGDGRTGLSDIGGFALDPKSSQFYYQSPLDSSSVDNEKIKFPPIKPVVINLNSDSEDEDQTSSQKYSSNARKEPKPEPSSSGAFDYSLDLLLKSLRNAKPTDKDVEVQDKPKRNSSEIKGQHSDSTPHVVRHLSKRQQVEYCMLKEELRRKEIMQRRKMQQKRPGTTSASAVKPSSSHNVNNDKESAGTSDVSTVSSYSLKTQDEGKSGREVSLKEMGRLKIQLSNIASAFDKHSLATANKRLRTVEEKPQQPDFREDTLLVRSADVSNAEEEEDEETLRMMVLHTLKKNTSEKKGNDTKQRKVMVDSGHNTDEISPSMEDQNLEVDKHPASLKVVIHQPTSSSQNAPEETNSDPQQNNVFRKVVITDGRHTEDNESDQNDNPSELDEKFSGEWMVLDQVQEEEDTDGSMLEGSLEPVSKPELSESESCMDSSVNDCDTSKISENEINSEMTDILPDKVLKKVVNACSVDVCASDSIPPQGASDADEEVSVKKNYRVNKGQNNKTSCKGMKSPKINGESDALPTKSRLTSKTKLNKLPSKLALKSAKIQKHSTCSAREMVPSPEGFQTSTKLPRKEDSREIPTAAACRVEQEEQSNKSEGSSTKGQEIPTFKSIENTDTPSSSLKKEAVSSEVSADNKESHVVDANKVINRTSIQDKELQLKNVEKAYTAKRGGMNHVISQLDALVQEATQEEQERQTLRKAVTQLRAQLADMEVQLETKADALKTKMEKIRSLHKQILADRQTINKLQRKGELLGRQVYGSNYILPKVLLSPHSKTQDTHVKKALASSIDALRRVRNTTSTTVTPAIASSKVVRPLTTNFKDSGKGQQKSLQNNEILISKLSVVVGNNNTTIKSTSQVELSKDHSGDQLNSSPVLKTQSRVGVANVNAGSRVVKRKNEAQDSPVISKASKVQDNVQSNSQDTESSQGTDIRRFDGLDEMSELCPHDLLGRCNDDACVYQHIAHCCASVPTTLTKIVVQVSTGSVSSPTSAAASGSVNKAKLIMTPNFVGKTKSIVVVGSVSSPKPVPDSGSVSYPKAVGSSVSVSNTKLVAGSVSVSSPETVAAKEVEKCRSVARAGSIERGRGLQITKNNIGIPGGDSLRVEISHGEADMENSVTVPMVSSELTEIKTSATELCNKADELEIINAASSKASLPAQTVHESEVQSDCDHSSSTIQNHQWLSDAEAESCNVPLPVNQRITPDECSGVKVNRKDIADQEQEKASSIGALSHENLAAGGCVNNGLMLVEPSGDKVGLEKNNIKSDAGLDCPSDKREMSNGDIQAIEGPQLPSTFDEGDVSTDEGETSCARLSGKSFEQQEQSMQNQSCSRDREEYLSEETKMTEVAIHNLSKEAEMTEVTTQETHELGNNDLGTSEDAVANNCPKRSTRLKTRSTANVVKEEFPVTESVSTGMVKEAETRSSKRKRNSCSTDGVAGSNQDKGSKMKVVHTVRGRRGRHRGRRKK